MTDVDSPLPPYVDKSLITDRLRRTFPDGTPNRSFCTRDLAVSTVFAMLYIGAVEGTNHHLAPKHVYRMTDKQAGKMASADRLAYARNALERGHHAPGRRWYADNTREPIRDETLREGLVPVGAVVVRSDLPTTSSRPRYALKADFAALFHSNLSGAALDRAIRKWQKVNLSPGALARVSIVRLGAAASQSSLKVTFPNGETRLLAPGPSSVIAQAVIEGFASRFLVQPAVLWLSESGNKVVERDDRLASAIGLTIEADKNLPDMILVDLGPADPIIVFVEAVATDGAVTARRRAALLELTNAAGFKPSRVTFLTAYLDRQSAGFRKTVSELAWGSFAWFASEPDRIMVLRDGATTPAKLAELMTGQP